MLENLSVLVPVYNEEANIGALVSEIHESLEGILPFEILVINDASSDASKTILQDLHKKYSCLRIIHHIKRAGQSAAILTGATQARYQWIATLDGDGQNDPKDILKLIRARFEFDEDGSRVKPGIPPLLCIGYRENRQDAWSRKMSSKIANKIRNALLKDQNRDSACGIKLFPRDLFLQLPHFRNDHRFLPALFLRAGANVISVPVSHRTRLHGTSKYGLINRLGTGIIDLLGVAWLMRRKMDTEIVEDVSQS